MIQATCEANVAGALYRYLTCDGGAICSTLMPSEAGFEWVEEMMAGTHI